MKSAKIPKKAIAICIVAIMFVSALITFSNANEVKAETKSGYALHNVILIEGNSGFNSTNGVSSGDGSQENPYIIEGWDIDASNQNGIETRNTDKYFIIRNCYVHEGFRNDGNNSNDYNGIYFYKVKNGKIENSEIKNSRDGIYLSLSNNNQITNNSIYNNWYAIYLYISGSNQIYLNNFVYNTNQAYDDGTNNWDFNGKGNYWNDYTGKDNNEDGIGDTPYECGYSRDNYPLMSPNPNAPAFNQPQKETPFLYIGIGIILIIAVIIIIVVIGISMFFMKRKPKPPQYQQMQQPYQQYSPQQQSQQDDFIEEK